MPKTLDAPEARAAAAVDGTPTIVSLEGTSVTFGRGEQATRALEPTDLKIRSGEFVALVGPSGCGKSTILKLVAGLIRPTTGNVFVAGREVAARAARVGMAFQNTTMLPWLRVRDNIMMPLKIVPPYRAQYKAERRGSFSDKVDALLAQVGLTGFGDKYPWQLSGGMLQRASLCRALIHEPRLLVCDEPTSALDAELGRRVMSLIRDRSHQHDRAVIVVTHDDRIFHLADRIAQMDDGLIKNIEIRAGSKPL